MSRCIAKTPHLEKPTFPVIWDKGGNNHWREVQVFIGSAHCSPPLVRSVRSKCWPCARAREALEQTPTCPNLKLWLLH